MSCETVGLSGAGSSPSDRCYSNPVTSQSPSSWVVDLEKSSVSDVIRQYEPRPGQGDFALSTV